MSRLFVFLVSLLAGAALAAETVRYSYDNAGRLTKVDYGNGRTVTYTYDRSGNLTSREVTAPSESGPEAAGKTKTTKANPGSEAAPRRR